MFSKRKTTPAPVYVIVLTPKPVLEAEVEAPVLEAVEAVKAVKEVEYLNPQDPNNALHFIKLSMDEANNPTVTGPLVDGEIDDAGFSYLGNKR